MRPTPYKRTAATTPSDAPTPVAAAVAIPAPASVVLPVPPEATAVVGDVAGGRAPAFRRRLPSLRSRPAFYLAAALVGAFGVSTVATGYPAAGAESTVSHSVSVAHELGIGPQPVAVTAADATRLRELAASRNQRGAAQIAAARVQTEANRKAIEKANRKAIEAARPKAVLPVNGARLTSTYGMRWGVLHAGIDLAAPIGTPEYAVMDGVVVRAGAASGFGLAVYIQHANGDVTVYGHMEKILVREGQVVHAGDTIALLGANGQATGPHLHLEVHVGGMMGPKIDPLPWLRTRGVRI